METNKTDAVKPGVRTSEFWTAATVFLANLAPAVVALLKDRPWAAATFAALGSVLPVLYVWGRAVLKKEAAGATSVVPDAWEPVLDKVFTVLEAVAGALPAKPEAEPKPATPDEAASA